MPSYGDITAIPPGSMFLSRGHSRLARAEMVLSWLKGLLGMAKVTPSELVTHAGIYLGSGQICHAVGRGVTFDTLDAEIADVELLTIWSHPLIGSEEVARLRRYCEARRGLPYDNKALKRFIFPVIKSSEVGRTTEICITFQLLGLIEIGLPLLGDRWSDVSPDDARLAYDTTPPWRRVYHYTKEA